MKKDAFAGRLSAYRDGEVDGRLGGEISSHLRQCRTCREELAELERVDSLVKKMPELEPSACFSSELILRIGSMEQGGASVDLGSRRTVGKLLDVALSLFDRLFGEGESSAALDEFGDFPPLSMSHAYFGLTGLLR